MISGIKFFLNFKILAVFCADSALQSGKILTFTLCLYLEWINSGLIFSFAEYPHLRQKKQLPNKKSQIYSNLHDSRNLWIFENLKNCI